MGDPFYPRDWFHWDEINQSILDLNGFSMVQPIVDVTNKNCGREPIQMVFSSANIFCVTT